MKRITALTIKILGLENEHHGSENGSFGDWHLRAGEIDNYYKDTQTSQKYKTMEREISTWLRKKKRDEFTGTVLPNE
jgi:hypothetical protein